MKGFVAGREAQLCLAVALLAALAGWPYGYYQFLRWAVCAGAAYCGWRASREGRAWWVVGFVGLALLFNPFRPVHFNRDVSKRKQQELRRWESEKIKKLSKNGLLGP